MWRTEAYAALNRRLDALLGGRTAAPFETLGISTVGDLLRHVPRRYLRGAEDSQLRDLRVGQDAVFIAQVESATEKMGSRHRVEVVVGDGTARVHLTFFVPPKGGRWFPKTVLSTLHPGARGLFFGKVGSFQNRLQLTHPDYVTLDEAGAIIGGAKRNVRMGELASQTGFIGLYPATAKLPTWTVAQTVQVARELIGDLPEPLPAEVRTAVDVMALARADRALDEEPSAGIALPDLATAVEWVHRPLDLRQAWLGRQRFLFDEAFAVQATMAYRREAAKAQPATPRRPRADGLLASFDQRLLFALTGGQQRVSAEIFADLERPHPMQRLLQGEVGSGKTLVALRAMLTVVDSGGQAVLLAPTEVLAQQHHRTIVSQLGELAAGGGLLGPAEATSIALLTGSLSTATTRAALLEIASGAAGIVIGTHALLSDRVQFADLGLVVVDEQHRFGVEQRAALNEKGVTRPHKKREMEACGAVADHDLDPVPRAHLLGRRFHLRDEDCVLAHPQVAQPGVLGAAEIATRHMPEQVAHGEDAERLEGRGGASTQQGIQPSIQRRVRLGPPHAGHLTTLVSTVHQRLTGLIRIGVWLGRGRFDRSDDGSRHPYARGR